MPEVEDGHIVETPTEARAGVTGRGVRYVLAVSTAGAAVALLLVLALFLW